MERKWQLRLEEESERLLIMKGPEGQGLDLILIVYCPSRETWEYSTTDKVYGRSKWLCSLGPEDSKDMEAMLVEAIPSRLPPRPESKEEKWNVHDWRQKNLCNNCGLEWTKECDGGDCSGVDAGEQALVQLAGCLVAAEGNAIGTNDAEKGNYGWSPAFQAVKELWEKLEVANNRLVHIHGTIKKLEGYLLSGGRENERLEKKIRAQDKAHAQVGVEYHDLVEGFKRSAEKVTELRKSLEAERAANADKVQTITRQCQERRAIKAAVERDDIARLREILFPPESDELESVEEPEIKTVVLDAGPDHLKIVEIENVTALRAERDELCAKMRQLCQAIDDGIPESPDIYDGLNVMSETGRADWENWCELLADARS